MPIFIKPTTATNPSVIPTAGSMVEFQVIARSQSGNHTGRFEFILDPADGYRWDPNATTVVGTAMVDAVWRTKLFDFRLTRTGGTSIKILVVRIQAVLVDGNGVPISVVQNSNAFLTFDGSLGELLAAHRKINGLSQKQLGKRLSISRSWVSSLEHGAMPSETLLAAIKTEIK